MPPSAAAPVPCCGSTDHPIHVGAVHHHSDEIDFLDTRTGQIYTYRHPRMPCRAEDDGYECESIYIWAEGNYSCDCNRSIFCGLDEIPCYTGIGNVIVATELRRDGVRIAGREDLNASP